MLAGNDDIDKILGTQARIHGCQEAVCIGRKENADDIGIFIGHMIHEARILMGKSIMVLLPYSRAHHEVQGGNAVSPWELIADFQPFCMLGCHRIDNPREGFIGVKEAVTASQKISFQPAFAHVFRQHGIHDASRRR